MTQEKQFCRNCGKRDEQAFEHVVVCANDRQMVTDHAQSRLPEYLPGERIEPASDYTIERCERCNKVKRITGNYHGTLTNGLTYASQWCSCPVTKHDGNLGGAIAAEATVEYDSFYRVKHISINGGYGDIESRDVTLDAKQALSLLAWLRQEEEALKQLAKE